PLAAPTRATRTLLYALPLSVDVLAAVVDRAVEARHLGQPAALLLAAGDADHPTALDPRDLSGDRPGGTCGPGDQHRFARLRSAEDRKSTRLNFSHVKISYAV